MIGLFYSLRNNAFVHFCFRLLSRTILKLLSFSTWVTTRRGRRSPARRPCWAIALSVCCGTGTASSSPRVCSSSSHRPPRRPCSTCSSRPWPQRLQWPCTAAWPRYVLSGSSTAFPSGCCCCRKAKYLILMFSNLWIHRWWTNPWHLVPTSLTKSQWKGVLEQQVGASLSSASPGLGWKSLRYVEGGPWLYSQVQFWFVSQEGTSEENLWIVPTWFCSFAVMFHAAVVSHFFLVSSTLYEIGTMTLGTKHQCFK